MTHYLTQSGLTDLQAELKNIEETLLPQSYAEVDSARKEGDLRENAGFAAAKENAQNLVARIDEIKEILSDYEIITGDSTNNLIDLGDTFVIEYEHDGRDFTFTIVGGSEADAINGKISNESPLAKAVLGKKAADSVQFRVKNKVLKATIKKIMK